MKKEIAFTLVFGIANSHLHEIGTERVLAATAFVCRSQVPGCIMWI